MAGACPFSIPPVVWAECVAEYEAWYAALGERTGNVGMFRGQTVVSGPLCHCGRVAHAKGLCSLHYQASRYIRKIRRARPTRRPRCHPNRKHWGRGLCRSCYDSQPDRLKRIAAKQRRYRARKAAQKSQPRRLPCAA
jgi:hypothetical protein